MDKLSQFMLDDLDHPVRLLKNHQLKMNNQHNLELVRNLLAIVWMNSIMLARDEY